MQFQIKQVGRALSQETTHEMARNNLDKLTVMLFHHTKTSEEAYYVGEMTRGAEPTVAMKVQFPCSVAISSADLDCFSLELVRQYWIVMHPRPPGRGTRRG